MRMVTPAPGCRVPLSEIDLHDPERYRSSSQHPSWHTLRHEAPVWAQTTPDGTRFWSVTRHADVSRVLMDDRRFSSEYGTILAVTGGDSAGGKTINLMDQPKHAAVRLPTMRTMSTHVMRLKADDIRAHLHRLWAQVLADGGDADVASLALHLPTVAIAEIIGVPQEVWPQLPYWAMAGVAPGDLHFSLGSTEAETLKKAHYELFALFSELIRKRRGHREDDLVSLLIDLDFRGRRMDDPEILLNCYSFVMGALTTTPHVVSHWIGAMISQPEAWQQLRAEPSLVPLAVEEALRWASPTNHLMRRTQARVKIGDTWLEEGELVCAWIGSANRDSSVFSDPYRFNPGRVVNPHLGFGIGAHRCIGGPAAQVALAVLMQDIVTSIERIEQVGDDTHLYSNFINGVTALPVRFHHVASSAR